VDDIGPAIASLGHEAKLLCVYGGDGTIQRILDRLSPTKRETIHMAFLGGGTMNVTARWCGLSRRPGVNFREVVNAYMSGQLSYREVPLLEVHQGNDLARGFTFGIGPLIRLLDNYEKSKKGRLRAVVHGSRAAAAALTGFPSDYAALLDEMQAEVSIDDEPLPYDRFSVVMANVTGLINPGVTPFVEQRARDTFHCAAYAVPARDFAASLPMLMRGWLPMDVKSLIRPDRLIRRVAKRPPLKQMLPPDERYVNKSADHMVVSTDESFYTIDGEILPSDGTPLTVSLGPHVRLAVSPSLGLRQATNMAAKRILKKK
jgi:hypothetical protein